MIFLCTVWTLSRHFINSSDNFCSHIPGLPNVSSGIKFPFLVWPLSGNLWPGSPDNFQAPAKVISNHGLSRSWTKRFLHRKEKRNCRKHLLEVHDGKNTPILVRTWSERALKIGFKNSFKYHTCSVCNHKFPQFGFNKTSLGVSWRRKTVWVSNLQLQLPKISLYSCKECTQVFETINIKNVTLKIAFWENCDFNWIGFRMWL